MDRVLRASLTRLAPRHPFYPDLMLSGLREVVRCLKSQPGFCSSTKGLIETDRHIGRYSAPAIDQVVKSLPRHAQNLCRSSRRQAKRLDTIVAHREAWVRRVSH